MEQEITITKSRLESYKKDSATLRALEAMGVDNWEGYSEALATLPEEYRD